MKIHPVADMFRMMDGDEFDQLKADIKANGLREPIYTHQGAIVDGRNRMLACKESGVKPRFKEWDGKGSLVAFVVSLNLHRRHLTPTTKATTAVEAEVQLAREAKDRMRQGGKGKEKIPYPDKGQARDKAAKLTGANPHYVTDAKKIKAEKPELFEAMKAGEKSMQEAKREIKREAVVEKLTDVQRVKAQKARGLYDVIVIDPPWPMKKIERDVRPNQVEMDYPTMTEHEIAELDVPTADDCHVWVWTTHKFLPMALRVIDAWGMKYVCCFTWHKPGGFQPIGLPQYNCEFALYARIGSPAFVDTKAFPVCFDAPRGKHSEKPEAFYEVVRRVTAGRRIDMFNRRPIKGFDAWGNEAGQ